MAKDGVGYRLISIGTFTHRVIAAFALLAFAANDGEGNNDTVADAQTLISRSHLDDFSHELMTHNVAVDHARNKTVVKMQVGTANGTGADTHNGIARLFDDGIGNDIAADIVFSMIAESFHP